jgi:hypothetical protein
MRSRRGDYPPFVPNGKPGDSPITDVVVWKKEVFGERTDSLIREIDEFTSDYGVFDPFEPVEDILWAADHDRTREVELYEALVALRDRLRNERGSPPSQGG